MYLYISTKSSYLRCLRGGVGWQVTGGARYVQKRGPVVVRLFNGREPQLFRRECSSRSFFRLLWTRSAPSSLTRSVRQLVLRLFTLFFYFPRS
jgi:hypothetical protein